MLDKVARSDLRTFSTQCIACPAGRRHSFIPHSKRGFERGHTRWPCAMSRIRLCTYSRDLQRCQAAANSFVRIADLIVLLQASIRSGIERAGSCIHLADDSELRWSCFDHWMQSMLNWHALHGLAHFLSCLDCRPAHLSNQNQALLFCT